MLATTTGADFAAVVERLDRRVFEIVGAEVRMARTAEITDGLIKLWPLPVAYGVQAALGTGCWALTAVR